LLTPTPLARRALAEFCGTAFLVTVVVGSGIAAASLSPRDVGLRLFENAFATALGLAVLVLMIGPMSGAHFNPVVSLVDWWLGRRAGTGLTPRDLAAHLPVQVAGAVAGAMLANLMYAMAPVSWSTTVRAGGHLWFRPRRHVRSAHGLVPGWELHRLRRRTRAERRQGRRERPHHAAYPTAWAHLPGLDRVTRRRAGVPGSERTLAVGSARKRSATTMKG